MVVVGGTKRNQAAIHLVSENQREVCFRSIVIGRVVCPGTDNIKHGGYQRETSRLDERSIQIVWILRFAGAVWLLRRPLVSARPKLVLARLNVIRSSGRLGALRAAHLGRVAIEHLAAQTGATGVVVRLWVHVAVAVAAVRRRSHVRRRLPSHASHGGAATSAAGTRVLLNAGLQSGRRDHAVASRVGSGADSVAVTSRGRGGRAAHVDIALQVDGQGGVAHVLEVSRVGSLHLVGARRDGHGPLTGRGRGQG